MNDSLQKINIKPDNFYLNAKQLFKDFYDIKLLFDNKNCRKFENIFYLNFNPEKNHKELDYFETQYIE